MNSLSFCLFDNLCLIFALLRDIFIAYRIMGWQGFLFIFYALQVFHVFLINQNTIKVKCQRKRMVELDGSWCDEACYLVTQDLSQRGVLGGVWSVSPCVMLTSKCFALAVETKPFKKKRSNWNPLCKWITRSLPRKVEIILLPHHVGFLLLEHDTIDSR